MLRPGDFVTARIEAPALEGVARLPAAALDTEDRLLVVDEARRLRAVPVTVIRRLGDDVIAGEAPFGARYVLRRRPNLGPGLLVDPLEERQGAGAPARVALTPDLRRRLADLVERERSLTPERRARLLAAIDSEAIDRETLERIERMGGARAGASDG